MSTFGVADLPIESRMLTNALDEAQRKVRDCFLSPAIRAHVGWPSSGLTFMQALSCSAATRPFLSMVTWACMRSARQGRQL